MRRIDARCERKNFMGAEMLLRKMGSVLFDEARRLRRAARRTRGPTTPMQSVSRCVGDIGVRLTAGKAVSVRPQDAFARHSGQASRLRADQRDHLAVLRPGTLPRSFLPRAASSASSTKPESARTYSHDWDAESVGDASADPRYPLGTGRKPAGVADVVVRACRPVGAEVWLCASSALRLGYNGRRWRRGSLLRMLWC